jgi:SMC interacting uncharacterized protein involved in chromosome segregation
MSKLTPQERKALIKQVDSLNAKIRNPRLTIEEVDKLHTEREAIAKKLRDDREQR